MAEGRIRARRSGPVATPSRQRAFTPTTTIEDGFPEGVPLSVDSRDIPAYVDRPLAARKPAGYQRDFLEAYQPQPDLVSVAAAAAAMAQDGGYRPDTMAIWYLWGAILNRLRIDLSWASSQLDGNSYTRLDTRELIEHGQAAQGKAAFETQMILNHKAAIELLIGNADTVEFNRFTLFNLHRALSETLCPIPPMKAACGNAGWRSAKVFIARGPCRPRSKNCLTCGWRG
ncbi:hypothetical protein [Acidiferrobacter sp.]|uniref:hypothetical protein n=1 Tax=Acidiferrobacter sp. TaxID=1872107 RepID=UPI00262E82E1|nr:hypothetical protein [Acidiferrobacter sp.]